MRVLLVTHYYAEHGGGVEIVAGQLAARLACRGVEITWAAGGPAPSESGDGIAYLPMRAWNGTEWSLGFPYPVWSPASTARLCRAARSCDIVHLHDSLYLGNVVAFLRARVAGKPTLVTQHVGMVPYRQSLLRGLLATANRTLGRFVLGGASQAIFVSHKVREYFRRFVHFQADPLWIPNGLATETFFPATPDERRRLRKELGWPGDRPVFLFVGRFMEKKGLSLVRALAARFPDCQWVTIGWGPDDPSRWPLANVRSLGRMDHARIAPCYRAADLLVLPSVGEGFPLVVQESMACGTPALISEDTALGSPGIERMCVVSPLDEESLAGAVRGYLDRRGEWEKWRDQVACHAREHWDWDRCAEQYGEICCSLLEAER